MKLSMTAFAWSRGGLTASYDYAERYPLIVEAIGRLKVASIVVDGEAMCASPER
jgi:ATP-dependent DNA ligase